MVLNSIRNNTNQNIPKLPPLTLVTGYPGTGKSTVIHAIRNTCKLECIPIFITTFNNINALHVGGSTYASTINLWKKTIQDEFHSMDHPRIAKFKIATGIDNLESSTRLIIIDEVSNLAPFHLAQFSVACQQATRSTLEFGGIPVIMFGDFRQLGPVKAGSNLVHHAVRMSVHNHMEDLDKIRHIVKFTPRTPQVTRGLKKLVGADKETAAKYIPSHPLFRGSNKIS